VDFNTPRVAFGVNAVAFGKVTPATDTPQPHKAKAAARRMMMFKEASALLDALPQPGESVHCITSGRWDLAVLVAALVGRHPSPCRRLTISTLAYARRNVVELVGLLGQRKVGALTLLASKFFQRHYKELDAWTREQISAFPGCRYGTARCHAKCVCLDFDDAAIVMEGSANQRACGSWENLCVTHDRALLDFHATWINRLVSADDRSQEA
jgi:hypothetical protein